MSTHRKDFIFKIWYRNQVNWLGTVKNHCVCTKDATFPPDGLFFKAEQRTSTCTFIYFGCVWFFSVFYTQNILADLSWMRLAEEMGKKKMTGRRRKAAASSLWCGKWKRGWESSQLWNVVSCTNMRTEYNSSSNNSSFWSRRWFWRL